MSYELLNAECSDSNIRDFFFMNKMTLEYVLHVMLNHLNGLG